MIDRGRLGADYGVVRLQRGGPPSFGSLKEAAEAGYHGKAVNIEGKGVQKVEFADKNYDKTMAQKSAAASGGGSGSSSGAAARNVVSNASNQSKGFFETLKSVPSNIARDVSMGFSAGLFSNRDTQRANLEEKGYSTAEIDDYFARTDATIARNEAEAAARMNRSDDSGGIASLAPATMSAEELAKAFAEGKNLAGQTQQSLQPLIMEYLRGKGITDFGTYLPKIFETLQIPAGAPIVAPAPVFDVAPVQPPAPPPVEQPVQPQPPAFTPITPIGSAGAYMPAQPGQPGYGLPNFGQPPMQPGQPGQPGQPPLELPPFMPIIPPFMPIISPEPPEYGLPPLGQSPDPFGLRQGFV
jgi:hypothetical protein